MSPQTARLGGKRLAIVALASTESGRPGAAPADRWSLRSQGVL